MHTQVQRVLDVPHGSTLVLVPRAEDADWLNINRPLFAQLELRVVLFCDTDTTIALARHAVDFFDWISHRVECPNRPPRFAVAGIRCALAARAPGIVWTGGDLEAAFAEARPRSKLHKVSAARPYAEMLAEVKEHRRAWIAWTDVDSHFRLRRVRWVHAEAGHRTRAILLEPAVSSPGWWPMHARLADVREAREHLEKAGASSPGCVAALNDLEPEALELMQSFLEHGLDTPTLESALLVVSTPEGETDPSLEALGRQFARDILRGEVSPPVTRAFRPEQLRQFCQTELSTITQQLEANAQVELVDVASWVAWTTTPDKLLTLETLEHTAELWLRNRAATRIQWDDLSLWASTLGDLSAAEWWARRAVSEELPHARLLLAGALHAQEHHEEADRLIQSTLSSGESELNPEHPLFFSVSGVLARVLQERKRYEEAESLLRRALSAAEHDSEVRKFQRNALLHQLASVLLDKGKYREAEALLRDAISMSPTTGDTQDIGLFSRGAQLKELARAISAQGRYVDAEPPLREAVSLLESTLGTEHPLYGSALHDLATLLQNLGRYAESEPLLRQVLSTREKTVGAEHPTYTSSLHGLAATLRMLGKYEEAEARQRQVLALEERTLGSTHPSYGSSLHGLAIILQAQGRYAEAEKLFRQALALSEQALGPSHSDLCPMLSNLGAIIAQQGRPSEGEPFLMRALQIAQENLGPDHPDTARVLNLLAQTQNESGNQAAPETARQALDALIRTLGPTHPYTQRVIPSLQAIIAKRFGTPGAGEP